MEGKSKKIRGEGQIDFILLVIIICLLLFGLMMLFSASSPSALEKGNIFSVILKQGAISLIGCACMFVTANFDYHSLKKLSRTIIAVTFLMMFLVPFRITWCKETDFSWTHKLPDIRSSKVCPCNILRGKIQ